MRTERDLVDRQNYQNHRLSHRLERNSIEAKKGGGINSSSTADIKRAAETIYLKGMLKPKSKKDQ